MRKYIEIGKIVNTHGVRGTVKVEPWCDSPSVLAGMKKVYLACRDTYTEMPILKGSIQKDRVLLTFKDITSIEEALPLKNTVLYADRNDIPVAEGAFLIDDLKGLPVLDIDTGRLYGTLSDVLSHAAGELYEVKTEKGPVLIPAVKEFVKRIDLSSGIYLRPIGGMFDEN